MSDRAILRTATSSTSIADATVRDALELYFHSRTLSAETIRQYNKATKRCFSDWLGRRISEIKQHEIVERIASISETAPGPAMAGLRVLHAIAEHIFHGTDRTNPAKGVTAILHKRQRDAGMLKKPRSKKRVQPEPDKPIELKKPVTAQAKTSLQPVIEVLPKLTEEARTLKRYNLNLSFVAADLADVSISFSVAS